MITCRFEKRKTKNIMLKVKLIILSILAILVLTLGLAWVSTDFVSLQGWVSFLATSLLGAGILFLGWRSMKSESVPRWVGWLMIGAAILRLLAGVLWFVGLPRCGTEQDLAGYVMSDPYTRDQAAWELAQSEQPLSNAFSGYRMADQYGGLLFLSAGFYRYLGGVVHQPLQMVVLTASFSALVVLFGWAVGRRLFDEKVARLAAWVLTLYPEAVLHGSSQMREAFMVSLAGTACYGLVLYWQERNWQGTAWVGCALLFSLPLSPLFALMLAGTLVLLALVLNRGRVLSNWRLWAALAGLVALALLGVWLFGKNILPGGANNPLALIQEWIKLAARWQAYHSERLSGWVQKIFRSTPEWTHVWLLVTYGVARPFLPAALFDSAAIFKQIITIWRSLGWTVLLALLVLAPFWAWRKGGWRGLATGLSVIVWLGILVASFRGGGDMWDNPRYRVTWISLQAVLAAWVWVSMREEKSPWLRRILIGMGLVLFWFVPWYLRRITILNWPIEDVFLTFGLGLASAFLYMLWDGFRLRKKGSDSRPENGS
jgi:hypothetical protein